MEATQQKPRAAAYIRVSRDKSDYQRQISDLKRIAEREGYLMEDSDIYAEKITGRLAHGHRAALTKLLDAIRGKTQVYKIVLLTEVSRIARRAKFGREIHEVMNELGVPMKFSNLGMASLDANGKPDRNFNIVYNMMLEFAEEEWELIKSRSSSGKAERARRGGGFGGLNLPYGYKKDQHKILIECEEEAPVVRDIFNMSLKGLGTVVIAKILNAKNIQTKSQRVKKDGVIKYKGGREKLVADLQWSSATVLNMLKNPIYCGKRLHLGETVPSPVLIEEDVFYRVQELLTQRDKAINSHGRRHQYVLAGLLRCGRCGKKMYSRFRQDAKKKEEHYQCESNRMHRCCENRGVNLVSLESTVWGLFLHSPKMLEKVKDTSNFQQVEEEVKTLKDLLAVELKEKANKEGMTERLLKAYLAGVKGMTEERLKTETTKVEKQIKQHEQRITQLKTQIRVKADQVKNMNTVTYQVNMLEEVTKTRKGKAEMLQLILDKVVVTSVANHNNNSKNVVSIYFKDLLPPITAVMYVKPRLVKQQVWTERWADNGLVCAALLGEEDLHSVEYDEEGRLVTTTEQVLALAEKHREHLAQTAGFQDVFNTMFQQLDTKGNISEITINLEKPIGKLSMKQYMMQYPLIPMELAE